MSRQCDAFELGWREIGFPFPVAATWLALWMPELCSAVCASVPQYSDIPSCAYVILQLHSLTILPSGFPYVFGRPGAAAMRLVCVSVCARVHALPTEDGCAQWLL